MNVQGSRGRLLTLAIAFFFLCTLMLVTKSCVAQARQFQIISACFYDSLCINAKGRIAFTDSAIYLNYKGQPLTLQVVKTYSHRGQRYYHVRRKGVYYGVLILNERSVYFEFNAKGYDQLIVRYVFKQFKT